MATERSRVVLTAADASLLHMQLWATAFQAAASQALEDLSDEDVQTASAGAQEAALYAAREAHRVLALLNVAVALAQAPAGQGEEVLGSLRALAGWFRGTEDDDDEADEAEDDGPCMGGCTRCAERGKGVGDA